VEAPTFIRVTELSRISGASKGAISTDVRKSPPEHLQMTGSRVVGIAPEGVQRYLGQRGFEKLYRSALFVFATQTGGAGKTSSCWNMAMAARRITDRKHAIVLLDCDSQASLSVQAAGAPCPDDEPTLLNWLQDTCELKDILHPLDDNVWITRSNLNNIFLDRALSKSAAIKSKALELTRAIFAYFGEGTKIFVDTPPQLSSIGQSFVCAVAQSEVGHLMIPVRCDLFGVKGAKICLTESFEAVDTFGLDQGRLGASVFISNYDQRVKTSVQTLALLSRDAVLQEFLAPVAIRHSSEVTKAGYRHGSCFDSYRNASTIGADYTDLLLAAMGWQPKGE
jgi:cellulose biosynthesis protein BcsQ